MRLTPHSDRTQVIARANLMLDLAPYVGVNLDDLEHARRRLAEHEGA